MSDRKQAAAVEDEEDPVDKTDSPVHNGGLTEDAHDDEEEHENEAEEVSQDTKHALSGFEEILRSHMDGKVPFLAQTLVMIIVVDITDIFANPRIEGSTADGSCHTVTSLFGLSEKTPTILRTIVVTYTAVWMVTLMLVQLCIAQGHPDAVVAFIKERKWAAFDCLLTIPLSVMGFIVLLDTDGNTFQNINMHDFLWCYPIWRITRIAEAVSACVNFADMTDIMSARLGSLTVAEAPDLSYKAETAAADDNHKGVLDFGSKPMPCFEEHESWVRAVVNMGATKVVSAGFDGKLIMTDLKSGAIKHAPVVLDLSSLRCRYIAIEKANNKGVMVAAVADVRAMSDVPQGLQSKSNTTKGSSKGMITVWNTKSNALFIAWFPDLPRSVCFGKDNESIFVCGDGGKVGKYYLGANGLTSEGDEIDANGGKPVRDISFAEKQNYLLTVSEDTSLRLFDADSLQQVAVVENAHPDHIYAADMGPSGCNFVSGGRDKLVCLWDIAGDATSGYTIVKRREFFGHTGYIFGLAVFGQNAEVVLSCSDDAKAVLWDGTNGAKLHVLNGHEGAVMDVCFMPQKVGANLYCCTAGGPDHTLRVWDVITGIGPPANKMGYQYDCYICHGDSPYSADLCVAMADFFRASDKRLQVAVAAGCRGTRTNMTACKSAANFVMLITTGCFKGECVQELLCALSKDLPKRPVVVPILPQGNAFPDLSGRNKLTSPPPAMLNEHMRHQLFEVKALDYFRAFHNHCLRKIMTRLTFVFEGEEEKVGEDSDGNDITRLVRAELTEPEPDANAVEEEDEEAAHCYDAFMSHKQITAGDIARFLFQSMSALGLTCFLDVADDFKLHDLEANVRNSSYMVVIITPLYFDSYWCRVELKMALKSASTTVVVLHDVDACNFPKAVKRSDGTWYCETPAEGEQPEDVIDTIRMMSKAVVIPYLRTAPAECINRLTNIMAMREDIRPPGTCVRICNVLFGDNIKLKGMNGHVKLPYVELYYEDQMYGRTDDDLEQDKHTEHVDWNFDYSLEVQPDGGDLMLMVYTEEGHQYDDFLGVVRVRLQGGHDTFETTLTPEEIEEFGDAEIIAPRALELRSLTAEELTMNCAKKVLSGGEHTDKSTRCTGTITFEIARSSNEALLASERTATKLSQRAGKNYDVMVSYAPKGADLASMCTNDLGTKGYNVHCFDGNIPETYDGGLEMYMQKQYSFDAMAHTRKIKCFMIVWTDDVVKTIKTSKSAMHSEIAAAIQGAKGEDYFDRDFGELYKMTWLVCVDNCRFEPSDFKDFLQNGKPRLYNKLQECVDLKRIVKYTREPYGVGHTQNCQAMIKAAISKMELPSVTN